MNNWPIVSMIFCPLAVREVALARGASAAVFVNAATGMFLVAAISLLGLPPFTGLLVVALTLLFGPLAGFVISSLYSRVEWVVGKRLGGKASHDELYRLFAWAFLPIGFAALLFSSIRSFLDKPSSGLQLLAAIPTLLLFFFAIRNYCANTIVVQQFSRIRGSISIFVSCVLFLMLVIGCSGLFSLFMEYVMQYDVNPFM